MYNHGYQGNSSPTLTDVTFSGNSAERLGGAMFNHGRMTGHQQPHIDRRDLLR